MLDQQNKQISVGKTPKVHESPILKHRKRLKVRAWVGTWAHEGVFLGFRGLCEVKKAKNTKGILSLKRGTAPLKPSNVKSF